MGKVYTTITVTNRADQILARNGVISSDAVRSVTIENASIDTNVTKLCLPANVIEQLGLELAREVTIRKETGIETARIFRDVSLEIHDRAGTFECLELPNSSSALVGRIPLDAMGLKSDNQTLNILPDNSAETYLTIPYLAIL
ncbi:aspartyl protease [Leptolyngbya sp. AN03gr2]|uniref:aspartyl protease n=1 Tax=unclassified Leptolyngbya TaxID=2650499 RepID=UPI003D31BAD0